LNLGKPPENISADALFNKINSRLDDTLRSVPDSQKRIGKPLFTPKNALKDSKWDHIEKIQATLEKEYNLRKKMLMTRLDVTIQSFKWSDRIKGKEKDITERFSNKQQILEKLQLGGLRADIPSLLAARDKLAIIEKTSSANVRKNTNSKIQRHIMGKVPDRGGRALELQRPPAEMPSWQKRQPGGDNRGRGGNRGNFNQNRGGHQQHHQQQQQQQQGYPPQQFQQKGSYNPSNQQLSNNYHQQQQQQQPQQQSFDNQRGGGGSRVQGGWNQGQRNDNFSGDYQQQARGGGRGRGNYRR